MKIHSIVLVHTDGKTELHTRSVDLRTILKCGSYFRLPLVKAQGKLQ
jgi:hypothetical protein